MSAGFIRRYTFDPGLAEILKIEGVVIIDRDTPGQTTGQTTGATCLVAEFEDGPFNTPVELFGGLDQLQTFGGFGFTQDGLPSSNPCARARYADSALTPEYWNGNGFLALSSKVFPRLFCVRADTSVGAVAFTKCPSLIGSAAFSFDLEPGATAIFRSSATVTNTATFSAATASLASAAGAYPTTFVGGESFNVTIDAGTPLQIGPIDVTFTAAQSVQADVVARINAVLGYTAAVASGGNVTTLTGRIRGNTGSVVINSVSGSIITTKLGFSAATSAVGTGNVGNIDAVSFAEVKSVLQAAVTGLVVDRDANGNLRATHTTASELLYTTDSTADALGFPEAVGTHPVDGFAYLYTAAGTYPTTFAGTETLTLGFDGEQNVTIAFANTDSTQAQVISKINSVVGFTCAVSATATVIRFNGRANGGQVRIVAYSVALVGTALGLTGLVGTSQSSQLQVATTIPAGTRVRDASAHEWLTMQSTAVPATGSLGPFSIKVRPSLDDGTATSAAPAAVTTIVDPVASAAFTVTNPLTLSAALSEAAIDAAYATAIDSTLSPSAVTREANFIYSARQSNAIRTKLRDNAVNASKGLRGRVAAIRPPLGTTTRAVAKSTSAQPGVGAYRNRRAFYCYPGWNIFVPQIAVRGTAGGAGFTATGFLDVGADGWFCSVAGRLPPEQNAGQETTFMTAISSLEVGNPDVQNLQEADYESFKASGIVAARIGDGVPIFQSDVTSYDPTSGSTAIDGPTVRFADYAEDSLAIIANKYAKKPMTRKRRSDVYGEFTAFLELLKSPGNEDSQRIDDYRLDASSGVNPKAALDAGVFRIRAKVKMTPDMLDIVIDASISKTVSLETTLP